MVHVLFDFKIDHRRKQLLNWKHWKNNKTIFVKFHDIKQNDELCFGFFKMQLFILCKCFMGVQALFESGFVMKVFWPFLPIFQRLLLLVLPFLSYINYCANGFLCYAVYVNHLLCRSSNSFSSSSSKCPLVVKSWKLLNSFDMIWDGNKVLEKVVESSASSWTTHGV